MFIKICSKTITNEEFPTAIYRLGVCYEKGYGVEKDYGKCYLLYQKTIEQFHEKCKSVFNTVNMSILNVYSFSEAQKRIEKIKLSADVEKLKETIKKRFEEETICPICIEDTSDTILFPCTHMFCRGCYNTIVENGSPRCPKCRSDTMVTLAFDKYI